MNSQEFGENTITFTTRYHGIAVDFLITLDRKSFVRKIEVKRKGADWFVWHEVDWKNMSELLAKTDLELVR